MDFMQTEAEKRRELNEKIEKDKTNIYGEVLNVILKRIIDEGIDSVKNENGYDIEKLGVIITDVIDSKNVDTDLLIGNVNSIVGIGKMVSSREELEKDIRKILLGKLFSEEHKRYMGKSWKDIVTR